MVDAAEENKKLGQRIREARKAQKLTQQKLATALGIAFPTLNKYENGHRTPEATLVLEISKILSCDPGWLLSGKYARTMSLPEIINQLKTCDYKNSAGLLVNNAAFIALEAFISNID